MNHIYHTYIDMLIFQMARGESGDLFPLNAQSSCGCSAVLKRCSAPRLPAVTVNCIFKTKCGELGHPAKPVHPCGVNSSPMWWSHACNFVSSPPTCLRFPPHVVIVMIKCISFGKSRPQRDEQNSAGCPGEDFSKTKGLKNVLWLVSLYPSKSGSSVFLLIVSISAGCIYNYTI